MIKKLITKRTKTFVLLSVLIVLVISLAGCKQEEVVAEVNDAKITKDEFYDKLVEQSGTEVMNALISEKIIEMEIEKNKIVVTDEEIEEELDKIKEYYGSEELLIAELKTAGYTIDDIKGNITTNLQVTKLLEPYITITEDEKLAYFEANKASLNQAEEVKASHILVKTKEEADNIKAKLDAGEDFAELAKEFSTDDSNSQSGGDLGFFGRGAMVPSFDEAAFSLEVDKISNPVETEFGFHLIKVIEKKEAKVATYEDFKDDVADILSEEKMGPAYSTWYQEKIGEYDITNSLVVE